MPDFGDRNATTRHNPPRGPVTDWVRRPRQVASHEFRRISVHSNAASDAYGMNAGLALPLCHPRGAPSGSSRNRKGRQAHRGSNPSPSAKKPSTIRAFSMPTAMVV